MIKKIINSALKWKKILFCSNVRIILKFRIYYNWIYKKLIYVSYDLFYYLFSN